MVKNEIKNWDDRGEVVKIVSKYPTTVILITTIFFLEVTFLKEKNAAWFQYIKEYPRGLIPFGGSV